MPVDILLDIPLIRGVCKLNATGKNYIASKPYGLAAWHRATMESLWTYAKSKS